MTCGILLASNLEQSMLLLQGSSGIASGQSGFAAAAMGPAFDDGVHLNNNLLNGHSLGNQHSQVVRPAPLVSASS